MRLNLICYPITLHSLPSKFANKCPEPTFGSLPGLAYLSKWRLTLDPESHAEHRGKFPPVAASSGKCSRLAILCTATFHFRKVNYEWSSVNSTSLKSTRNIIHKILGGSEASASTAIHSFLKQIINLLDATLRPWSLKPWRCGNSWQDKVSQSKDFLTTEKKHDSNEHFIDFIHFKSPRLRWKHIYQTQKPHDIFGSSPLYWVHEFIKAMEISMLTSTRLCSHNFPSVSQGLGSPPVSWLDTKCSQNAHGVFSMVVSGSPLPPVRGTRNNYWFFDIFFCILL